jgi:trehalose/maltose hydrolase-like predicted phosphorylase
MNPIERTWQLYEAPFNPAKLHHIETIYTVGNGYMGVRATFEEGYPDELVSTLVHGIFDHKEGELVPELVVLPNPLPLTITVDGEPFGMKNGKILGYRHSLDMQTATLTRSILWQNSKGQIVTINFERFASLERQHLLAQRITVRALNGSPKISIRASIDGTTSNEGVRHWKRQEAITAPAGDPTFGLHGVTGQSGYGVTVASTLVSSKGSVALDNANPLQPGARLDVELSRDEAVEVYRYTAIHTTRDAADPTQAALSTLGDVGRAGYPALHAEHAAAWSTLWYDADIVIEGDELAQRAVRFCTYHILISAPRHEERASIGAKTLSGPGYKGHVFWDTELFMVPLLTLTQPKVARNLLMYRYHTLQGARNKAKEAGYEGAMYPWEATDTGEETTPRWTNPLPDGSRIRIWTGDNEQHISTDIAYAVLQYWHWTNDNEFFVHYGAEIILDTAVFWGTRAEWNDERGRYELRQQIGPDEYHENVDNSAFTNSVVRWHLETALTVLEWLHGYYTKHALELEQRLHITPGRIDKWKDIIDKMYIPKDERGVLEQFDGFFDLEPIDLSYWTPKVANIDSILGHEAIQKVRAIKQADIVMLMALLPEAVGDVQERKRNWDFYYPLVDHGSSLSPSMHAWAAARLGLIDDAYKMFMYGGTIDLEDNKGNVRDGIHAAAAGGLWQGVVFGFAGLTLNEDGTFSLDPNLPPYWKSVQFRIFHQGQQRTIRLTNEGPA